MIANDGVQRSEPGNSGLSDNIEITVKKCHAMPTVDLVLIETPLVVAKKNICVLCLSHFFKINMIFHQYSFLNVNIFTYE